jgi:hypothetical protein
MAIWRHIHWPDGTRKSHLRTLPLDERRCSMLQLVKALMDKYNDDHNLSGVCSFSLPPALSRPAAYLGRTGFYHLLPFI